MEQSDPKGFIGRMESVLVSLPILALRLAIISQVEKYGPILEKTVQQKIYLYSHKDGRYLRDSISLCWFKTYNVMRELVMAGRIAEFSVPDNEETWLIMPNYLWESGEIPDDVMDEAREKMSLIASWRDAIDGHYAERLVAEAFEARGYTVSKGCTYSAGGTSFEVDVMATKAGVVYMIEVKNRYSECFHPPITRMSYGSRTQVQRDVWDYFDRVRSAGCKPVLIASFADRSLTGWVRSYRGKYMNLLYQILPPGNEEVSLALREKFKLGHVKCFASPPDNLVDWVGREFG